MPFSGNKEDYAEFKSQFMDVCIAALPTEGPYGAVGLGLSNAEYLSLPGITGSYVRKLNPGEREARPAVGSTSTVIKVWEIDCKIYDVKKEKYTAELKAEAAMKTFLLNSLDPISLLAINDSALGSLQMSPAQIWVIVDRLHGAQPKKATYIAFGGYGLLGLVLILLGTITSFQIGGQSQWLFLTLLVLFFINFCLGLVLIVKAVNNTAKGHELIPTSLASFHVLLNSVLIGFWLFCRSYNGDCTISSFNHMADALDCNPEYNSNALPFDTLIFAMMTPLLYTYIFTKVSRIVLLVSWMIIIAWIAICIGLFNAYNATISLIIYAAFSAMILFFKYENQKTIAALILQNENNEIELKRSITKSKKDAKEIQSRLGNVAHDLKTVR